MIWEVARLMEGRWNLATMAFHSATVGSLGLGVSGEEAVLDIIGKVVSGLRMGTRGDVLVLRDSFHEVAGNSSLLLRAWCGGRTLARRGRGVKVRGWPKPRTMRLADERQGSSEGWVVFRLLLSLRAMGCGYDDPRVAGGEGERNY